MLPAFGASGPGFRFGLALGLGCVIGLDPSLGLENGPTSLFFKPYQLPPSPCVRCVWARAITFLTSDVISTCQLRTGSVRALSLSYVL